MMFIEGGVEYAIAWINGETDPAAGTLDMEVLRAKFEAYAKTEINIDTLTDNGVTYDNYLMILLDAYIF